MRSIKFRVWDTTLDEMLDMKEIQQSGMNLFVLCEGVKIMKLMQYTGLKDKNGKEIYEGDVISVINDTFQAEVIYEAPSFKLKSRDDFHVKRNAENKTIAWNAHIIYEVVGNIYEHPHLLEESK